MHAGSISAAGESDPIASDPGSCDAELRVVRRVVRVIDIDSVTGRDGSGPESGPTGRCQNSHLHVTKQLCFAVWNSGSVGEKMRNVEIDETRIFLGKSTHVYNTVTQKAPSLGFLFFFILTYLYPIRGFLVIFTPSSDALCPGVRWKFIAIKITHNYSKTPLT